MVQIAVGLCKATHNSKVENLFRILDELHCRKFSKYMTCIFYDSQSVMIMKNTTRGIKSKQIYAFYSMVVLKYIPIMLFLTVFHF